MSSADIQAGLRANNISTVSFWYNKNQKVTSEGSSGEITFGPPLPQRYNGSFQYAPLVADRSHWNIQIQNILLADGTQTMTAPITTIVDTGTTLVSLESSLFQKINQQMGGSPDRSGVYLVDCQKAKTLKPLVFQLTKDTNLTLTWDQQILVVKAQGLCVSIFQPSDSTGITNIIGATFLANFYTVFDYTNERIGFATPTGQGVLSLPNNFAVGKSANMLVNVMLSILLMSI